MRKFMATGALVISVVMILSTIFVSVAFAGQTGRIDSAKEYKQSKTLEDIKAKIAGENSVKVIITLKDAATDININNIQKKFGFVVGKKGWTEAYPNGFAATVKGKDIEKIRADPTVARVDEDKQLEVQLETANYWSGVTKARALAPTGYGVTGNLDGKPNNYSAADIVIAVLDTGIDPKHKDLTGEDNSGTPKIIGWYDAASGSATPYDNVGHGTHVASIAAGDGSGSARYKGVAPGAALVGVRVCYSNWCYISDMIDGMNWVIVNKAKFGIEIATMSIGGSGSADDTDPTTVAANRVVDAGLVFTIAAGNSGDQKYTISSPGSASKAITVGAIADPGYALKVIPAGAGIGIASSDNAQKTTGMLDTWIGDNGWYLAEWSSRGPTADNRVKPDVVAPGVSITAAQAVYPNTADVHGGYVIYSGTSMATPFVAGVAGLVKAANTTLTNGQIKAIIRSTAEDFGMTGCDIDFGCGRVRAYKAIGFAKTGAMPATDGPVVNHVRTWTQIKDRDTNIINYPTKITDDNIPFASTLVQYDWSGWYPGIDLDLIVSDPNAVYAGYSSGYSRQETVAVSPDSLGIYNATIYRWIGSGRYSLDRTYR